MSASFHDRFPWINTTLLIVIILLIVSVQINESITQKRKDRKKENITFSDSLSDENTETDDADFIELWTVEKDLTYSIVNTIINELKDFDWQKHSYGEMGFEISHKTIKAEEFTTASGDKDSIIITRSLLNDKGLFPDIFYYSFFEFRKDDEYEWVPVVKHIAFADMDELKGEEGNIQLVELGANHRFGIKFTSYYTGTTGNYMEIVRIFTPFADTLKEVLNSYSYLSYNDDPMVNYVKTMSVDYRIIKSEKSFYDVEKKVLESNWKDTPAGSKARYTFNRNEYVADNDF